MCVCGAPHRVAAFAADVVFTPSNSGIRGSRVWTSIEAFRDQSLIPERMGSLRDFCDSVCGGEDVCTPSFTSMSFLMSDEGLVELLIVIGSAVAVLFTLLSAYVLMSVAAGVVVLLALATTFVCLLGGMAATGITLSSTTALLNLLLGFGVTGTWLWPRCHARSSVPGRAVTTLVVCVSVRSRFLCAHHQRLRG